MKTPGALEDTPNSMQEKQMFEADLNAVFFGFRQLCFEINGFPFEINRLPLYTYKVCQQTPVNRKSIKKDILDEIVGSSLNGTAVTFPGPSWCLFWCLRFKINFR